jgi:hypothetical protein
MRRNEEFNVGMKLKPVSFYFFVSLWVFVSVRLELIFSSLGLFFEFVDDWKTEKCFLISFHVSFFSLSCPFFVVFSRVLVRLDPINCLSRFCGLYLCHGL